MKKTMIATAVVIASALSWNVAAQDVEYLGATPKVLAEVGAQAANVPPDVLLVELERWRWNQDTFSVRPLNSPSTQHPGRREGVLGFISYTPFEGGHTLYGCVHNNWMNRFTSVDPNCEGHMKDATFPITGYIATTQLPGTVPLYRCQRGGFSSTWVDHFDTLDWNCENVPWKVNDGLIGYIWL